MTEILNRARDLAAASWFVGDEPNLRALRAVSRLVPELINENGGLARVPAVNYAERL